MTSTSSQGLSLVTLEFPEGTDIDQTVGYMERAEQKLREYEGITGLTTRDGRFTIMMPHPERVFRAVQNSWHPDEWVEDAPWRRLFRNARRWLG